MSRVTRILVAVMLACSATMMTGCGEIPMQCGSQFCNG